MKNVISRRIFASAFLAVILITCLTGCSKTKTYTIGGMSIKLPEGFEEITSIPSTDAALKKEGTLLAAVNETARGTLSGLSLASLEHYAEFIRSGMLLTKENPSELTERKDYYYFSVPQEGNRVRLFCMFNNKGDYWYCIFNSDEYDADEMLKWADSITFK